MVGRLRQVGVVKVVATEVPKQDRRPWPHRPFARAPRPRPWGGAPGLGPSAPRLDSFRVSLLASAKRRREPRGSGPSPHLPRPQPDLHDSTHLGDRRARTRRRSGEAAEEARAAAGGDGPAPGPPTPRSPLPPRRRRRRRDRRHRQAAREREERFPMK